MTPSPKAGSPRIAAEEQKDPGGMKQETILYPVFSIFLLTFALWLRMSILRWSYIRKGVLPADYLRTYVAADIPRDLAVTERHFSHSFQLPVLFYIIATIILVQKTVNVSVIVLAWAFAFARYAQCAIHLTYNNALHRGIAYGLG